MQLSFHSWSSLTPTETKNDTPRTYLGSLKEIVLLIIEKLEFDFLNFRATSLVYRDIIDSSHFMKAIRIEYFAIECIVKIGLQGEPIHETSHFFYIYASSIVQLLSPNKLLMSNIQKFPASILLTPFYSHAMKISKKYKKNQWDLTEPVQTYSQYLKDNLSHMNDDLKAQNWLLEQFLEIEENTIQTETRTNFWMALIHANPKLAFLFFKNLSSEQKILYTLEEFKGLGPLTIAKLFEVDWKESIELVKNLSTEWKNANLCLFIDSFYKGIKSLFKKLEKNELLEIGKKIRELTRVVFTNQPHLGELANEWVEVDFLISIGTNNEVLEIIDELFVKHLMQLRDGGFSQFFASLVGFLNHFPTYAKYRPQNVDHFLSEIKKTKIVINDPGNKNTVDQYTKISDFINTTSHLQIDKICALGSDFEKFLASKGLFCGILHAFLISMTIACLKPPQIIELLNGFQNLKNRDLLDHMIQLIAASSTCSIIPEKLLEKLVKMLETDTTLLCETSSHISGESHYLYPKVIATIALIDLDKALQILNEANFGSNLDCYIEIAKQLHQYKPQNKGISKVIDLLTEKFSDFTNDYLIERLWSFLEVYNESVKLQFLEKYAVFVNKIESKQKIQRLEFIANYSKALIGKMKT